MRVRDIERAYVRKLGAVRDSRGDHIYFYFSYQGSEYTVGKLSHSWRGDLNDTQVLMVARRLYLQKREFEQWVDCSLDNPQMIGVWQNRRSELS